jgi:hypothetical protein
VHTKANEAERVGASHNHDSLRTDDMTMYIETTPRPCAPLPAYAMRQTLGVGRAGALRVIEAAKQLPWVERVVDLDLDRRAQRDGYDLLIYVRGIDNPARVEVKCDRHATVNVYLETVSVVEGRVPGCLFTSKADTWAYLREPHDQIVWFAPATVANWLRRQQNRFRRTTQQTVHRGRRFHTRGVIVPLQTLEAEVPSVLVTRAAPVRRACRPAASRRPPVRQT